MAEWVLGDSLEWLRNTERRFDLVLADPPYETFPLINESIDLALRHCDGTVAYFMYAEDLCLLDRQPDRVCFWVKPVSTKNTVKQYSRFVEVIALYNVRLNQELHWANRSGIFTDQLVGKQEHPFQKPESLIERLILNHARPGHTILDPFAGSGTVGKVAERLGIDCVSIEKDSRWQSLWPQYS